MYAEPTRWRCRHCGGVGSSPTHARDCFWRGAGVLAMSLPIRAGREVLADAGRPGGEHGMACDAAEAHLRAALADVLAAIDQAAQGALLIAGL